MSEVASVLQTTQVGIEGTIGTTATINRLLQSVSFTWSPQADVTRIEPVGQKFASAVPVNREWTEWNYDGYPWYTELPYFLAPTFGHSGTPSAGGTNPAGATAYVWAFQPSNSAADSPLSLSIEQGDATRTHRASGNVGRDFQITLSRAANSFSGVLFGQRPTEGTADMTGGATTLSKVPILPSQVDVFLDLIVGNIGTTKLTRDFVLTYRHNNARGPVWPLNSALTSWDQPVDMKPTSELELTVANDAQGGTILDYLRNTTTAYIRARATGGSIAGTSNYRFTLDGAFQVASAPNPGDTDGVYALTWTFTSVYDSGLGKAVSIEVVNNVSAL